MPWYFAALRHYRKRVILFEAERGGHGQKTLEVIDPTVD